MILYFINVAFIVQEKDSYHALKHLFEFEVHLGVGKRNLNSPYNIPPVGIIFHF